MVGFVEHEGFDGVEFEGVLIDEIEEAAWGGDYDIGSAAQGHHLRVDGNATDGGNNFLGLGEVLAVIGERLRNLSGEFAGRHEDERRNGAAIGARFLAQVLQQRQGECGGFSRAGLGLRPDVAAAQDGGNRLGLHGCGHDVVARGEGANESRRQTESGERHRLAMTAVGGIWNP